MENIKRVDNVVDTLLQVQNNCCSFMVIVKCTL